MSAYRKNKEGYETFEGPKGHTFGGSPNGQGLAQTVNCFSLNIGKLELSGVFFLVRQVMRDCKKNYFFLQ